MSQLMHVGGTLLFLGTMLLTGAALVTLLIGIGTRRAGLRHGALLVLGAWALLYGGTLLVSPALVPARHLALGEEVAFCGGLDCHLHLSVVRHAGTVLTIRARSDAQREPEWPGLVSYELVDGTGRTYRPVAPPSAAPLAAGRSTEFEVVFAPPAGAGPLRLVMHWNGWPDYLVLGPDNARVQARTSFAL